MRCRFCETELRHTFVDLGMSPLCESYVPAEKLNSMEPFYPLHLYVCDHCFLVQLEEYVAPKTSSLTSCDAAQIMRRDTDRCAGNGLLPMSCS